MKLIIFGSPPPRYDLTRSHIYACFYDWLNVVTYYEKKEASRRATKNGKKSSKRLDWVSLSAWATSRPLTCSSQSSLLCCFFFFFCVLMTASCRLSERERCNLPCNGTNCEVFAEQLSDHCRLQGRNLGAAFENFFFWLTLGFLIIFRIRTWNVKTNVKSKWAKLFGQFQYKTCIKRWKFPLN